MRVAGSAFGRRGEIEAVGICMSRAGERCVTSERSRSRESAVLRREIDGDQQSEFDGGLTNCVQCDRKFFRAAAAKGHRHVPAGPTMFRNRQVAARPCYSCDAMWPQDPVSWLELAAVAAGACAEAPALNGR